MARHREPRMQHFKRLCRELVTDFDNRTYDTGRLVGVFAVLAMTAISAWDVIVNKAVFRAYELGVGIGVILGAVAVYIPADAKGKYSNAQIPSLPNAPGLPTIAQPLGVPDLPVPTAPNAPAPNDGGVEIR